VACIAIGVCVITILSEGLLEKKWEERSQKMAKEESKFVREDITYIEACIEEEETNIDAIKVRLATAKVARVRDFLVMSRWTHDRRVVHIQPQHSSRSKNKNKNNKIK